MLAFIKKITIAVGLIAVAFFLFQNQEQISSTMSFVADLTWFGEGMRFESPPFPVVAMIFAAFILGMLTSGFHGIYERIARKAESRSARKRVKVLEAELSRLRSKAFRDEEEAMTAAVAPPPESPDLELALVDETGQGQAPGQIAEADEKKEEKKTPMLEEPTL